MRSVFSGAKVQVCLRYVDVFDWRPHTMAADQNPVPVLISSSRISVQSENFIFFGDDPQAEMFLEPQ